MPGWPLLAFCTASTARKRMVSMHSRSSASAMAGLSCRRTGAIRDRQALMDHRYGGGAFADRRANTLDRAAAHIAHGEHARDTGLQRGGYMALAGHRGQLAGQHEAVRIDRHTAAAQPLRFG